MSFGRAAYGRSPYGRLIVPATGGGGGGTTQNVTFSTAALMFSGLALGANAKAQSPVSTAALTFSGHSFGVDAKVGIVMASASLSFAGAVSATGAVLVAISQASIGFGGQALNFVGKSIERLLALLGVGN